MKDDIEKYVKEEQKISEMTDIKDRKKALLKRYKREQRIELFNNIPLWALGVVFLIFCAISFGLLS